MLLKTEFSSSVKLDFKSKFIVSFDEGFEFSLTPKNLNNDKYIFQASDFKGDFEMTEAYCGDTIIPYNKEEKTFVFSTSYSLWCDFYILADIEYKRIGDVCIDFDLKFPENRLKLLKLYECFEEYFVLPNYQNIKLKYYVKKYNERCFEVHIENPMKIKIQDRKNLSSVTTDDVHYNKDDRFNNDSDYSPGINLNLSFIFDPKKVENLNQISEDSKTATNGALYEIMSNTDFADVVIFSSSNKEILSYRCVLAKYSTYFAKQIHENKEVPVKFNLKDDDTETIKAALEFCYGKKDSINGMETKLFEFAVKYEFDELKHACSVHFEKSVNPKNVCEIVEIAYSNNFENLMQKCNKILAENKEKIDPTELQKLPKDILIKLFFT